MAHTDPDTWWTSLTVVEKERIATKLARRNNREAEPVLYPACTTVWMQTPAEVKQKVYDHCTADHGLIMGEWTEGFTMSY